MSTAYSTRPRNDEEARAALLVADDKYLGNFGEAIWRNILKNSGYNVVSLTKITEGGAPLAHGRTGKTILPDYDAYRDGRSIFVESKAKSQSIYYRNKKSERHGINYTNWTHYKRIQEESGKSCFLGIVELNREELGRGLYWSGALLFESMRNMGEPIFGEHAEKPPKVYWPRKLFSEIDHFSPYELYQLARGELRRSYEFSLERIVFPKIQKNLID